MARNKSDYLKSRQSKTVKTASELNTRSVESIKSINKSFVTNVSPLIVRKNEALQRSSHKMGRILLG